MIRYPIALLTLVVALACGVSPLAAGEVPPEAAWSRPLGLPLENPGAKKASLSPAHFDDGYWQGAPVGGFGAGTFSRTYRGDFARWHVKTGVHKYQDVPTNQFAVFQQAEGGEAVATVLYSGKPESPSPAGWRWDYPVGAGDYRALYPKSWYEYRWEELPARLTLEQFSPILPGNMVETSYPIALYHWHTSNPGDRPVTVGLLMSWTNMVGWFRDFAPDLSGQINGGNINRPRSESLSRAGEAAEMKGIVFDRLRQGPVTEEWDGQFAIAALQEPGVEVSYVTTYSPLGPGTEVWQPFSSSGRLPDSELAWASSEEQLAGAVAVTFTLQPGESRTVPMALAWDLPITQFGQGRKWLRRYTDFFGTDGQNAWEIARTGLVEGADWSAAIDRWQAPWVEDESKPLWYRGMLFNELYILADGGTLWGRPLDSEPGTVATFGFLECFDYPFYSTLDVRFYGSMPLAELWPEIDKQVMRVFADTVTREWPEKYVWAWKTMQERALHLRTRKARGAVPHDLGDPSEDPIVLPNKFSWQDTNGWKDLNSKFVLMVYRDFVTSGGSDLEFLRDCWPAVEAALEYLRRFDTNGDGLPESEGFPDQTYDVWVMEGESAYTGGLWLAALRAAEEMARLLAEPEAAAEYRALFELAQRSYIDKLWNGEYFSYDTASEYRDDIMADQLAGQWYATTLGLGEIVPREMRLSALRTIFDNNVLRFGGGKMGAANGMSADGEIITSNEQAHEVWTGTTYALAALMLAEGMVEEAYQTARGVYDVAWKERGYWFRTPEAWDEEGRYRASMYMRPAAIWAMEMVPQP